MTPHHLAIAMEYAPGGDLSEYVDACKRAGVCLSRTTRLHCTHHLWEQTNITSSIMAYRQHDQPVYPLITTCVWKLHFASGFVRQLLDIV
jgi:hypothetical protein